MNTGRPDLSKRFRELSDDDLLSLCGSASLDEAAQSAAIAELKARGLETPYPPCTTRQGAEYEGDFVTVAQFLNPVDANIVQGVLEAAGIPAVLGDEHLARVHSLLSIAIGGVRLRVPAAHVTEAQQVIAAYNRGDFALPDEGD